MGDLNTMQDATMITTLFRVLATLWVTGPTGGRDGTEGGGRVRWVEGRGDVTDKGGRRGE